MEPKDWRLSAELTLVDLAKKIGTSDGYLSDIERGVRKASGSIIDSYDVFSKGLVGPKDFRAVRERYLASLRKVLPEGRRKAKA